MVRGVWLSEIRGVGSLCATLTRKALGIALRLFLCCRGSYPYRFMNAKPFQCLEIDRVEFMLWRLFQIRAE
jgi:hypothetical protein